MYRKSLLKRLNDTIYCYKYSESCRRIVAIGTSGDTRHQPLNQSLRHNPNCKTNPPPLSQNKSAFEKAQESAQKGGVASGLSGMDASALGDMDLDALMASLSPEEVAQMEQLMKDMGDVDMGAAMDQMQGEGLLIVMYSFSRPKLTYKPLAKNYNNPTAAMQELAKMSPEELANSMAEVMQSPEIQDMLNDPATMLQQMKGSGLMDDAQVREDVRTNKRQTPTSSGNCTTTFVLTRRFRVRPAPLPNRSTSTSPTRRSTRRR